MAKAAYIIIVFATLANFSEVRISSFSKSVEGRSMVQAVCVGVKFADEAWR